MTKPWGIGCCACQRVMAEDGTPLGHKSTGAFRWETIIENAAYGKAAEFDSKEDADQAGRSLGWMCSDGNHRCPDCKDDYDTELVAQRRGCYVNWNA